MNSCTFTGNLGADPEVRSTGGGQSVCNLRLAVNERRKDRDGNWTEHTEWVPVIVWGTTADNCGKYLRKGSKVLVNGRLSTRKWTDKAGVEKYTTEITADVVEFLDPKSGGERQERQPEPARGGYGGGGRSAPVPEPGDDDIPFVRQIEPWGI